MKLYNTLSMKKEEFLPMEEGKVKMYACGPTVYNFFHVGNARVFVLYDMLRRYFEYKGYQVTFVQNFTDVDDKIIKRAAEEEITVSEVSEKYIEEYFKDAKGLGIRPASIHPKATENIDVIIEIVQTLIEKGHAYPSDGDVYFRTRSFKEYGKLSHINIDDLESGARIDISEQKEDPLDFALWKAAKPGEISWDSPWGKGRPGWHIECSAMVKRYLGESIDIHCGGMDLSFPHHENEIAQSECATGKPFAHFWLHNGYINIDNEKMSKSKGNFFTVRDLAQKYGYEPIRFFILSAHYRSPVNFSPEVMEQSQAALERIYNCADNLSFKLKNTSPDSSMTPEEASWAESFSKRREELIEVMDDDFNTAGGIGILFELIKDINTAVNGNDTPSYEFLKKAKEIFDEFTSLFGLEKSATDADLEKEILSLIEQRTAAKKAKNYAEADAIRQSLAERGILLEDTPQGTKYRIVK